MIYRLVIPVTGCQIAVIKTNPQQILQVYKKRENNTCQFIAIQHVSIFPRNGTANMRGPGTHAHLSARLTRLSSIGAHLRLSLTGLAE